MIRGTGFSIVSFEVKNFSCLSLKGALNKSFGQHVMAGNMAKPAKTRPFPVAREGTFRPTRYITVLYPSHCPAFKEFRAVPYWVSNIKIFSTMSVRLVHIFHPERWMEIASEWHLYLAAKIMINYSKSCNYAIALAILMQISLDRVDPNYFRFLISFSFFHSCRSMLCFPYWCCSLLFLVLVSIISSAN